MRVLTVGNSFPPHDFGGGYEAVWLGAVHHLEQRGHAVRVLTVDHLRAPDLPEVADAHRELRWYWHDHAFPRRRWRESLAIERHNLRVLAEHLAHFRPDVVSWWSMGALSMSLLEAVRRRELPGVAFVHDEWLDYGRLVDDWHRRTRRYPAWLLERALHVPGSVDFDGAAHYAFVSDTMRVRARATGLSLPDTSVIHSGIDTRFALAPEQPWRERLLYVGRLDERKGIATAVEATASLEGAVLTIAGEGPDDYVSELLALAGSLGAADRVKLLGRIDPEDLPALYAAADVVVFPVLWREPWGLVPLEAMATGRPVVATGRGGSGEYLVDGVNCLLYPAGEADALAACVRRLGAEPELRERLRRDGLETAERHRATRFNTEVEAALELAATGGGASATRS